MTAWSWWSFAIGFVLAFLLCLIATIIALAIDQCFLGNNIRPLS